jgi:SPP1 gp7 family putative phage head morphogenesis protein
MANKITDVLWHVNAEVDKLSGVGLKRMAEVLDEAEIELTRALRSWKALGKGDARFTAQVYRNALVQIRSALARAQAKLGQGTYSTLVQTSAAAGALATANLIYEVEAFSSIFAGTIRPVAIEASSIIARGDDLLFKRYKNSALRYAGQVGEDIRKQLAIGVIKGETIDQLTERLSKHGGPKGLVSLRGRPGGINHRAEMISEGLFKRYRYWGERLARTEVVNAYNEYTRIGIQDLDKDDPGYFIRWDAAIDGRVCVICRAMDDMIIKPDGVFPGGFRGPPRHPQCRCAAVAWRKDWKEADRKDDLLYETTRGKTPKGVSKIPHTVRVPRRKKSVEEST